MAVTDDEIATPSFGSSPANLIRSETEKACSSLRFHMDNCMWDIIHNEVMDWRDSSWSSMNIPGNKTCESTVLLLL